MSRGRTQTAWASLDALITVGTLGDLSDGQLLDYFERSRGATGQEAFRILVERHGAMVLGVCRSLMRDPHEAEDAFQATFLVLVRRSGSIRGRETIAPWLYGVASRVARRAKIRWARRRRREVATDVNIASPGGPAAESSGSEQPLYEEIRQLPESLRVPLILCCLEGQSYDLAARRLGVRESTLRGRLHRARQRLEVRLKRRGLLAPLAARLAEPGGLVLPALPTSLIVSTTEFATRWLTVSGLLAGARIVPESIAALARGALHAMVFQTAKVCGLATMLCVGLVGTLVVAQQEKSPKLEPPSYYPPPGAPRRDMTTPEEVRRAKGEWQQALEEIKGRQREAEERRRRGIDERKRNEIEQLRRVGAEQQRQRILDMLDVEVKLDLPRDATLGAFLKAVKSATSQAKPPGLPIYVDRTGLEKVAGKTLESPVDCLDIRSGKVGFLLRQALGQLHLSYVVRDGFVMISSREEIIEQRLDELDRKFDRILAALGRLESTKPERPSEGPR
jgi:RNA polymerase sigma factor (sigma-70 family)